MAGRVLALDRYVHAGPRKCCQQSLSKGVCVIYVASLFQRRYSVGIEGVAALKRHVEPNEMRVVGLVLEPSCNAVTRRRR